MTTTNNPKGWDETATGPTDIVVTAPASVEKLKADWLRDPCWDIEDTEGFEGYRDHLAAFATEQRARWAREQAQRQQTEREAQPAYWLKELVTEIKTMNAHLASIDGRLSLLAPGQF
jgi:hypothetical protein